ncbi:HAD-IA family hydrolase [Vermiphilus pyriformis]|jgi:HAD superfamily hydrolase (TIGR01549 family)|nr:MAG: HAD-IA family hydrolase [Vermiphilus pyriformis]
MKNNSLCTSYEQYNLIFDLGGILIGTDASKVCSYIQISSLMRYMIGNLRSPSDLKRDFYNRLEAFPIEYPGLACYDASGDLMPPALLGWFAGKISSNEILYFLDTMYEKKSLHAQLIFKVARLLLEPQQFIRTRKVYSQGIELLKYYKTQGHRLFILSNWDPVSYESLRSDYKEFIDMFDGVVISGLTGLVKPDPTSFYYILSAYSLDPQRTIFIDDQHENVVCAQEIGMQGILCRPRGMFASFTPHFPSIKHKIHQSVHTTCCII